jgi:hypothetical protein
VLILVIVFAADDFGPLARLLNVSYANSPGLLLPVGLAWLAAILALPTVILGAWAWKTGGWSLVARLHLTLIGLAASAFVWFLANWNSLSGRT